jgi:predicted flap endonuclease-1-like 5' DNA nuclease
MLASLVGSTAGVFQQDGGISDWLWIIIILILIVLVLWWLGRQERGPVETTGERKIEAETRSSGLPAVEDVAPVEGAVTYGRSDLEQAPVITPGEAAPQVVVPDAIVPDVVTPGLETYAPDEGDARDNVDVPVLRHETGPESVPVLGVENPVEEAMETLTPLKPDDLEIIEGIGPKIAGLLRAAGIGTFSKLAETPVDRLRMMMDDAHLRIADPTTWPEQARLAAEGRWDELKDYQSQLRGGRIV